MDRTRGRDCFFNRITIRNTPSKLLLTGSNVNDFNSSNGQHKIPTLTRLKIVKRRLCKYRTAPSNMEELWSRAQIEWRSIPKDIIENLVKSMPVFELNIQYGYFR